MTNPRNKLQELYEYAEQNNITVSRYDMQEIEALALDRGGDRYAVAINPRFLTSTADETVKAAHEIGHCATGTFYTRDTPPVVRRKSEVTASRWAIRRLLPADELKEAFRAGYTEAWQLAELFNLPEDFINEAMDYYRTQPENWSAAYRPIHPSSNPESDE